MEDLREDIKDELEREIDNNSCLADPDLDIGNVLKDYYIHGLDESEYTPEIIEFIE